MENQTNQENQPQATDNGITKIVSVYAVKTESNAVNYPTKARATDAQKTLALFGINATIETVKKKVTI